ncbi:sec14 cytosolic factor-like isoform X2 [Tasmannia lanceolata]|uniref:sec14 cytosolic factor-like isoform X2 n=1 Tax=Tasmannia lanceolata TaxID=3420 RepID=UPI0040628A48
MEKNPENGITQMRTSVEKLGSSTKNYGDATVLRFLVARSMDTEKAAKMFVQWKEWRAGFVPLGYIPENEIPHELAARKIFLQSPSKDGHPIVIVQAYKHFIPTDHLQFKKFVVHMLDKTIASGIKEKEMGNEKLVAILDLQHLTYKNLDARGLITGFQFLQAYYPERLAKLYILNMPWIFVSVWSMVSRFLEKATLQKVMIVKSEEEKRRFISEIGEDSLPEEYSGRAKLVALQDVHLNHWPVL